MSNNEYDYKASRGQGRNSYAWKHVVDQQTGRLYTVRRGRVGGVPALTGQLVTILARQKNPITVKDVVDLLRNAKFANSQSIMRNDLKQPFKVLLALGCVEGIPGKNGGYILTPKGRETFRAAKVKWI